MENNFKNTLFKRLILIENCLILAISIVTAILCLCDNLYGLTIIIISQLYILYPLILLTFIVACILKAVNFKDYKLNLALFIVNLPASYLSFIIGFRKFAEGLELFWLLNRSRMGRHARL